MTEFLYLKDCYIKEFDAVVTESGQTSEHEFYVILDKTAFYPEGGGEMSDTGVICWGNKNYDVFKVSRNRDIIKHWLHEPIPLDVKVHGTIDWKNRYIQMRLHTAQHVVSALVLDKYEASTVGNQLKESESRIDFKPLEWNEDMGAALEAAFNKIVDAKHAVTFEFVTRQEMIDRVDARRRKLFERLPESIDNVRLVIIKDVDINPCAGAHVKNTSELGHIEILRTENKGSQTRRLYYKLKESS